MLNIRPAVPQRNPPATRGWPVRRIKCHTDNFATSVCVSRARVWSKQLAIRAQKAAAEHFAWTVSANTTRTQTALNGKTRMRFARVCGVWAHADFRIKSFLKGFALCTPHWTSAAAIARYTRRSVSDSERKRNFCLLGDLSEWDTTRCANGVCGAHETERYVWAPRSKHYFIECWAYLLCDILSTWTVTVSRNTKRLSIILN